MHLNIFLRAAIGLALFSGGSLTAAADADGFHRTGGSPSRGLRPIGSLSPVDTFSTPTTPTPTSQPDLAPAGKVLSATGGGGGGIRQTAFMQGGGFQMPPGGAAAPPAAQELQPPPLNDEGSSGTPSTSSPPPSGAVSAPPSLEGLQPVPSSGDPLTAPPVRNPTYPSTASPSDAAAVPQPRLEPNWATADNCNLISRPSGYRAEFGHCFAGPVIPVGGMTYVPPPAVIVPPTVMPGAAPISMGPAPIVPMPIVPATAGHRPLFTLGQENYNVQIGQGIIGQPVAYVPGQSIRNFFRYLSP